MTDQLSLEDYENMEPRAVLNADCGNIEFAIPTELVAYRVKTLFTKEPDTIDWINNFESDEVFFDIGANVGIYSIWATMHRKVRTFAFEPEAETI